MWHVDALKRQDCGGRRRFTAAAFALILNALGPLVTWMFGMRSTLAQAAARYLRVGAGEVTPGGYYYEDALRDPPPCARDEAFADALWARLAAVADPDVRAVA